VAQADLYPHFSLFGSVGYQTNFLDIDDLVWSVGPALSWDIFNYGRIKNRVRVQDAVFQELVANYENTVLEAVREVEDASVAFLRSQETVNYLTDAVAQARRSVELSSLQYTEGLVDYQRVLDAQRSLSQQEDNLVRTEGSVGLNLIAVYKALGGGWEIRVGQDFVPQDIKQQMQERRRSSRWKIRRPCSRNRTGDPGTACHAQRASRKRSRPAWPWPWSTGSPCAWAG
jgi:outer membrane protein TolC